MQEVCKTSSLEEGYDLPDDRYKIWLKYNHTKEFQAYMDSLSSGGDFHVQSASHNVQTHDYAQTHDSRSLIVKYKNAKKSCKEYIRLQDNVCVSSMDSLTLAEYYSACEHYCSLYHKGKCCCDCSQMVKAANLVLDNGFCSLSYVFKCCFPGVTYTSAIAKRQLLQMPLAAITCGDPSSGKSEVILLEAIKGLNYPTIVKLLEEKASEGKFCTMSKQKVNEILSFAQSNREQETLRYTICQGACLTSSKARRLYGWESMSKRMQEIEKSIKELTELRESIEDLATTQELALVRSFGITLFSSESEDDLDNEETTQSDNVDDCVKVDLVQNNIGLKQSDLNVIIQEAYFNWFQFVQKVRLTVMKKMQKQLLIVLMNTMILLLSLVYLPMNNKS